ncbi:GNAT family N-acetyltransferase [Inquilinus sp.]|uniref:GNAT family N-acetyltransferase n=1 Tax=Inquilinus sp. TaxID=1932117 RepID=UPI0031E264F9
MDDSSPSESGPAGLTLRPATDADAGTLAAIHRRARESAAIPNLHSRTSVRRFLLRTIRLSQVMIACRDGVPVGYAALHNGWLDQLYIHPDHHRLGIGTALLAWARRDSPGLRLYCFAHNLRARAFYGAHGGRILSEGDGSDNEEGLPDLLIGFPEAWADGPSAGS